MQCIGIIKLFKRCKNNCRFFYCQTHKWQLFTGFFGICSIVAVYAGLYQDLIKPIFIEIKNSGDPVKTEEIIESGYEQLVHVVPGSMPIPLDEIKKNGMPDELKATLRIQARKTPILLSGKVKIKSFWFDPQYFDHSDGNNQDLKLLKSESNKISLEKVGDIAIIKINFKPYFIFPRTYYTVYNEGTQNTNTGKLILDVYFTYNSKEEFVTVEIPIRYS